MSNPKAKTWKVLLDSKTSRNCTISFANNLLSLRILVTNLPKVDTIFYIFQKISNNSRPLIDSLFGRQEKYPTELLGIWIQHDFKTGLDLGLSFFKNGSFDVYGIEEYILAKNHGESSSINAKNLSENTWWVQNGKLYQKIHINLTIAPNLAAMGVTALPDWEHSFYYSIKDNVLTLVSDDGNEQKYFRKEDKKK